MHPAIAFGVVLLFHLAEPLAVRLATGSGGPRFGSALAEALLAGIVAPPIDALMNRCRTGWNIRPTR